MSRIKTFFNTLWNTHSDPHFYRKIITFPLSRNLAYFFGYFFLVGLGYSLVYALFDQRQITTQGIQVLDTLASSFPEDIQITVSPQGLDIENTQVPIQVTWQQAGIDRPEEFTAEYLLVANDEATAAATAIVTLNPTEILVGDSEPSQRVPYQGFITEPWTINRQFISDNLEDWRQEWIRVMSWSPVFVMAYHSIFKPVFVLTEVVFLGLLLYLISHIGPRRYRFSQTIQLGLHAFTFAETVRFLQLFLSKATGVPTPDMYNWALLAILFVITFVIRPEDVGKKKLKS